MQFLQTKQFKKDRRRLTKTMLGKMFERLNILLKNPDDPLLDNHKLNSPWEGCRSISISGDIRLIYKNEKSFYRLRRVGSHSELYS